MLNHSAQNKTDISISLSTNRLIIATWILNRQTTLQIFRLIHDETFSYQEFDKKTDADLMSVQVNMNLQPAGLNTVWTLKMEIFRRGTSQKHKWWLICVIGLESSVKCKGFILQAVGLNIRVMRIILHSHQEQEASFQKHWIFCVFCCQRGRGNFTRGTSAACSRLMFSDTELWTPLRIKSRLRLDRKSVV